MYCLNHIDNWVINCKVCCSYLSNESHQRWCSGGRCWIIKCSAALILSPDLFFHKMQKCKTAKLQKCKTAPRCTWCSIDTLRPNLIRAGVRETKTSRDRLFHLKTLTIGPFLPLARLSLMSPDRGRWSILNPTPAFIQTLPRRLSHEMYTFKVICCIQSPSLPSSLLQIGQIIFPFPKK